jgi:hypothetical protein
MSKYAVGDVVYIDRTIYGRVNVIAGIVTKVTPKGSVTVKHEAGETRFTPNGREIGGDRWHHEHLISKERYDEARANQAKQIAARAAAVAIANIPARPTAANKTDVLAKIEAARVAVEAL